MPDFFPDRVVPAVAGDGVDLWVYAVHPKEEWILHSPGDRAHPERPGSAINYQDKMYEVLRLEQIVEGRYAFRYGLRAWDSRHIIRHLVNYTLKSQMEAAVARQGGARAQGLRTLILWLAPIAGFAPDPVQREWEKKTGVSMTWVSTGSALFGAALAFALRNVDSRFPGLVLYLLTESLARLFWITVTRRPHGSFLLTLPYLMWQGLHSERPPSSGVVADPLLPMRLDEVTPGPGGNSLRVCSWYFDTHLTGSALVVFEGAHYRPKGWHLEGKGVRRRWIYELEKVTPQAGLRSREYTHPRTPDRQKAVEDFTNRLDLAHSFALIWGIYPRRDQIRLHLLYQYEGRKFTAMTAACFLLIGALQFVLTAARYPGIILALVGPAYLILESLYRLYMAKVVGEPAGSVVGYILSVAIHPPK